MSQSKCHHHASLKTTGHACMIITQRQKERHGIGVIYYCHFSDNENYGIIIKGIELLLLSHDMLVGYPIESTHLIPF